MTIEEAGPNPARIADAIHQQLNHTHGEVPIEAIAKALDIEEICFKKMFGVEGALLMPDNRSFGTIVVNASSSRSRGRYTAGHELLHFLSLHHRPEDATGFMCTAEDLQAAGRSSRRSTHFRQEAEANRFAIEVLAPRHLVNPFLDGPPDLACVLDLGKELGLSREAATRRYVELNETFCAVVFTENGIVRYIKRSTQFPQLACTKGQSITHLLLQRPSDGNSLSAREDAASHLWLRHPRGNAICMQTLSQQDGFATTLLTLL